MTIAIQGGIAIAEKIASPYRRNPKVQVMLVGGSVATQCADGYSDLELGVFWRSAPSDEERRGLIEQAGGELWTFHSYQPEMGWIAGEHWGLSDVEIDGRPYTGTSMIDVKHMTVADMEQCLKDVVQQLDTSLDKQVVLSTAVDGISLIGDKTLGEWRSQARSFPTELAVKIVQENLWFGPWFPPQAYIDRDDGLVMRQHFIWAEQAILRVLAALNRVYYPSCEHKWMERLANSFQVAPPDLAERMKKALELDLAEGWRCLRALIDETIHLVEPHLPEVNSMALFEDHPEINIGWAQRRWEPAPPYTLMQRVGDRE